MIIIKLSKVLKIILLLSVVFGLMFLGFFAYEMYRFQNLKSQVCGYQMVKDINIPEGFIDNNEFKIDEVAKSFGLNISKEIKDDYKGEGIPVPYNNEMMYTLIKSSIDRAGYDFAILDEYKDEAYIRRFELLQKTKEGKPVILDVIIVNKSSFNEIIGVYLTLPDYMPGVIGVKELDDYIK